MNWFDRFVIISLAVGVWALSLKPSVLISREDNVHECIFEWEEGYGELLEDGEVVVHEAQASVLCSHY